MLKCRNTIKLFKNIKCVLLSELGSVQKNVDYCEARKRDFGDKGKTKSLVKRGVKEGMCATDDRISLHSINETLMDAYNKLRLVQNNDKERRVDYLHRLAEKCALEHNIPKETAICELNSHEGAREMFRTMQLKMDGPRSAQFMEVWTRDDGGNKVVLSECVDVENHLLQRNYSYFRQAAKTHFAEGDLGKGIHLDGTGDLADRILRGDQCFHLETKEAIVKKYIEGMAVRDRSIIDTVKVDVSLDEYQRFWFKKRETSATSPFGLHIGHYCSLLSFDDILEVYWKFLLIMFWFAMMPTR